MSWDMNAFSEMLDRQAEVRKLNAEELTKKLGEPHWKSGTVGYWRVHGGIVSYRFSLGTGHVIAESRSEWDDETLDKLHEVHQKKPLA